MTTEGTSPDDKKEHSKEDIINLGVKQELDNMFSYSQNSTYTKAENGVLTPLERVVVQLGLYALVVFFGRKYGRWAVKIVQGNLQKVKTKEEALKVLNDIEGLQYFNNYHPLNVYVKYPTSRINEMLVVLGIKKDLLPTWEEVNVYRLGGKPKKSITKKLAKSLREYGFLSLEKTRSLSEKKYNRLIHLLVTNKAAYKIALLNHVGFIEHIAKNHSKTNAKRDLVLKEILDISDREIKGQINKLNYKPENLTPGEKEPQSRYKSYQNKQQVEFDFKDL